MKENSLVKGAKFIMNNIQVKDLNSDNSSFLSDLERTELNTIKGGGFLDFMSKVIDVGKTVIDGGKKIAEILG